MTLNLKDVVDALDSVNIDRVEVRFYGGGDSGSIDSVDARSGDKWVGSQLSELVWGPLNTKVLGAIEDLAYVDVDASGVDWYNNDGGRCEWTLYKENDAWRVSLEVHQYHTESFLEHESDMLVSDIVSDDE